MNNSMIQDRNGTPIILRIVRLKAGASVGLSSVQIENYVNDAGFDTSDYDFGNDGDLMVEIDQLVAAGELKAVRVASGEFRYTDPRISRYRTKREQTILRVIGSHGTLTPGQVSALIPTSFDDARIGCTLLAQQGELVVTTPHASKGYEPYRITDLGFAAVQALA